jgi:hypothetical protein
MSPEDLLLVAHRNERFAMFWKYAEEDEDDAPLAMQALIAGQSRVPVTQEEADEVVAWCRGRIGCMPLPKRPSLVEDVEWPWSLCPGLLNAHRRGTTALADALDGFDVCSRRWPPDAARALIGGFGLDSARQTRLALGCGTSKLRPAGEFAQAVAELPVARQSVDCHHNRVPHGPAIQVDV